MLTNNPLPLDKGKGVRGIRGAKPLFEGAAPLHSYQERCYLGGEVK